MPATNSTPDVSTLERIAWVLAAAVLGLVVREVWQAWREREQQQARDRVVLSALLREVNVISGLATSILADLQREESLLQQGQVRLKPLVTLPVGVYDLVKAHAPTSLLKQEDAFLDLIRLQAQCAFTNALAAEQQRWKAPDARDQEDQLETLASFHPAIAESVGTVIERSERLRPALRGGRRGRRPQPSRPPDLTVHQSPLCRPATGGT